jgi:hypothetical protein
MTSTSGEGAFHLASTNRLKIDPQMSPDPRVLSFGELKRLKHISWNEEYIAQLVGAGLFPAPIHPGTWRESHIDDWPGASRRTSRSCRSCCGKNSAASDAGRDYSRIGLGPGVELLVRASARSARLS